MAFPRLLSAVLAAALGVVSVASPLLPSNAIEGLWTGFVNAPQGATELTLQFTPAGEDRFDVTMHMPRMHTYGYEFAGAVERRGGRYVFAGLSTEFQIDGDSLTGTFGISHLPFRLRRGGVMTPAPERPHSPPAPSPLWTRQLGSPTWAHPVASGGVVYVGTSDGKFHARSTSDGSERWTWPGTKARIDGRAVVAGDAVYFVDGENALVCLVSRDGTLRWRTVLHETRFTAGKAPPENPTFNRRVAIPLIEGDHVYCGSSDGGLYALDAATGQKRWRHDARSPIFSGVGRFDAQAIAFGTMDGSVVQFDPATGREIARYKTGAGVVTTPLLVDGKVIVGSRDYMLYGFNRSDGSVAWKFSYWFSWVESTPQLRDGIMYVGASDYRRVTAFDPSTGREIWSTDVGGMCWGWPAVTDDVVYIGTVAQNLDGTVIRHTGSVTAIHRHSGKIIWQHLTPEPAANAFGGVAGSLAISDNAVIGVDFDGVLTAWRVSQ